MGTIMRFPNASCGTSPNPNSEHINGGLRENRVDYQQVSSTHVEHFVNYAQQTASGENWVRLEQLVSSGKGYFDLLFMKLGGSEPTEQSRKLLESALLLASMGTGYHAPSLLLPRMVATTTKDPRQAVLNGLSAGLSSMGTHHLGSIYDVMEGYRELHTRCRGRNEEVSETETIQWARERLNAGLKIFGFGHPVYAQDPRPRQLEELVAETFGDSPAYRTYRTLTEFLAREKQISPNIDAALGLVFFSLGFGSTSALYLCFLARSLGMLCHIQDELPRAPFRFLEAAVPLEQDQLHEPPSHGSLEQEKRFESMPA